MHLPLEICRSWAVGPMPAQALRDEVREYCRVVRDCALDLDRGRLEQRWTTTDAAGRTSSRASSVKLYPPQ